MGKSSLPSKFSGSFCGFGFPRGWLSNNETSELVDDLNRRASLRRGGSGLKVDSVQKSSPTKRLVKHHVRVLSASGEPRTMCVVRMVKS